MDDDRDRALEPISKNLYNFGGKRVAGSAQNDSEGALIVAAVQRASDIVLAEELSNRGWKVVLNPPFAVVVGEAKVQQIKGISPEVFAAWLRMRWGCAIMSGAGTYHVWKLLLDRYPNGVHMESIIAPWFDGRFKELKCPEDNVRVMISKMRKDLKGSPFFIQNIFGFGYQLRYVGLDLFSASKETTL